MRISILTAFVLFAGTCSAAVLHAPIKSRLELKPGQSYTITVDSAVPLEIGWTAVQQKACATNCVEATDLNTTIHTSIATSLGASKIYHPADGKISVAYKNVSSDPVIIDIYRVNRTCEAEACRFIDKNAKGHSLTFKIKEFKSITTSSDGSYSTISAIAMSGRPFTVRAVWWSEDPKGIRFGCEKWIKRWLDSHAPPEKYSPYVLDGEVIGDDSHLVLTRVDTCVPSAPNFGAVNVFK
jgi:hypothetical protein